MIDLNNKLTNEKNNLIGTNIILFRDKNTLESKNKELENTISNKLNCNIQNNNESIGKNIYLYREKNSPESIFKK